MNTSVIASVFKCARSACGDSTCPIEIKHISQVMKENGSPKLINHVQNNMLNPQTLEEKEQSLYGHCKVICTEFRRLGPPNLRGLQHQGIYHVEIQHPTYMLG